MRKFNFKLTFFAHNIVKLYMRNFVGRQSYLQLLTGLWKERTSKLVSLYGRRRVGKTELIRKFVQDKKVFFFEALENEETPSQIKHFLSQLADYCQEPHLKDLNYKDWKPAFEILSQKMAQEPQIILVFDELPWMAAGRGKLVSYLKYFWDRKWKHHSRLLMILCGSVTSWMVQKVVRSKALYGRISENILVEPLAPFEVAEFIGSKRGAKEVLEYLLCFGGVPRYLEEFDFRRSIQLNMERTCFRRSGFFVEEAEKIFYSQFWESQLYRQIVTLLLQGSLTQQEISRKLSIASGGGLKRYVDNLVLSGIIEGIAPLQNFKARKSPRYYLADEFLRFHSYFIDPHLERIRHSIKGISFEQITKNLWPAFVGRAFERFCLKERYRLAEIMGFASKVSACGPMAHLKKNGYQYDLVYLRHDGVITLCEVKYLSKPAETKLIAEMEGKLAKTKFPRGLSVEKVLISNQEPSRPLQESAYFHRFVHTEEMIATQVS